MIRLLFVFNQVLTFVYVLLFGLSYLAPSTIPRLASVTLFTPVVIVLHVGFVCFWLVVRQKYLWYSLFTLLLLSGFTRSFWNISFGGSQLELSSDQIIRIMTYNVKSFSSASSKRGSFLDDFKKWKPLEDVNILFLQEASTRSFKGYPRKKLKFNRLQKNSVMPIGSSFSLRDYKVLIHDSLRLRHNAVVADYNYNGRIIRCINLHAPSFRFKKDQKVTKNNYQKYIHRLNVNFVYQEQFVDRVTKAIKESPYPIILAGDFNNNAFSYLYRSIREAGLLQDAFLEKGEGFGETFNFDYFPTRIDFVMVSQDFEVLSYVAYPKKEWSDHYPIVVDLVLKD